MEALPVQATSPIRIPTLAAQKQGVSAPLLGVQDQGLSQQVPSGPTPLQQLDAASVSTDLSASEQHVLQHLGWSLGRRGLEALKALADQSTSSDSSAPIVLKDFWNHFSSLSWLPHQKRLRQGAGKLMLRHAAQPAQHDEGLDAGQHAQHAKHEDFKIAQQVLQQVAKHAMQETAYVQSMRHIDMVNANSDKPSQKHEPSAGRLVTKSSGSNELLHFEIVQEPAAKDFPVPVPPQPAQGENARVVHFVSPTRLFAIRTLQDISCTVCACISSLSVFPLLCKKHNIGTDWYRLALYVHVSAVSPFFPSV